MKTNKANRGHSMIESNNGVADSDLDIDLSLDLQVKTITVDEIYAAHEEDFCNIGVFKIDGNTPLNL